MSDRDDLMAEIARLRNRVDELERFAEEVRQHVIDRNLTEMGWIFANFPAAIDEAKCSLPATGTGKFHTV